jgi:hypothetical protein
MGLRGILEQYTYSMGWRFKCITFSGGLLNLHREPKDCAAPPSDLKAATTSAQLELAKPIEWRHSFGPCYRRLCPGNPRSGPWSASALIGAPSHPFHHDRPVSPSLTSIHSILHLLQFSGIPVGGVAQCHFLGGRGRGSENMRRRRSHRLAGRRKLGQTRVFLPRPQEPWELARRGHGKARAKHPVSDVEPPRTSACADPIGDDDSTGNRESQGKGKVQKDGGGHRTIGWKSVVTHLASLLLFISLCTICDRPVFTTFLLYPLL